MNQSIAMIIINQAASCYSSFIHPQWPGGGGGDARRSYAIIIYTYAGLMTIIMVADRLDQSPATMIIMMMMVSSGEPLSLLVGQQISKEFAFRRRWRGRRRQRKRPMRFCELKNENGSPCELN